LYARLSNQLAIVTIPRRFQSKITPGESWDLVEEEFVKSQHNR
jgi:hypothetical protein